MERLKKQKGAVAVMTAILFPVLLTFTGIAVDVGRLYVEKAKLQNLADAAATSAMVELKKIPGYKDGSGKISTTIPIGAVTNNAKPEIIQYGDTGANYYLTKNAHLGSFQTTAEGVERNVYALRSQEITANPVLYETPPTNRFYYEIILSKNFPTYFARFVHPDDILVRAGAVCMIDIQEPDIINYEYAMSNWSTLSLEDLYTINPTQRLKVDREALRNLANWFAGKDKDFLLQQLGVTGGSNLLLGHYQEGVDGNGEVTFTFNPNNSTAGNKAGYKVINWLQGDYDCENAIDHSKRYLFSDYATRNQDGIKMWFTIDSNTSKITQVQVKINPADHANGSQPLQVTVNAP